MNRLELRLIDPCRLRKLYKIGPVLDIAEKVETGITSPGATYLLMSAQEESNPLYRRFFGFYYPVKIWVNQLSSTGSDAERLQSHTLFFWQQKQDSQCLVSFNSTSPEDNFKGEYEDAVNWVFDELKKRLGFS